MFCCHFLHIWIYICYCKILARGLDLDFWFPGLGADTLWCVHESGRVAAWHLGPNITKCLLTTCPHPDTATVVRGRVVGVWQYNHRQAGRRTIKSRTVFRSSSSSRRHRRTHFQMRSVVCVFLSPRASCVVCRWCYQRTNQPTPKSVDAAAAATRTNRI